MTSSRRVVAMGASAGGVGALRTIAAGLPRDFAGPILVVQHIGSHASILPQLLSQSGVLPAAHAEEGQSIEAGRIYVAPPDRHMVVVQGRIALLAGPKENFARPAIDPLFRSVALAYGRAAIGVVLTGGLDDGTSGLQAIKMCGGVAVVQDPATAEEPSMPRSALSFVKVDHTVRLESIAALLAQLVREQPIGQASHAPAALAHENALPHLGGDPMENISRIAVPSSFVCPECHGSLWRIKDAEPPRFRCYTGHAYTLQALRLAQSEGTDAAMWNALRALDEKHSILKELAQSEPRPEARAQLQVAAQEVLDVAHRLRDLIEAQPDNEQAAE